MELHDKIFVTNLLICALSGLLILAKYGDNVPKKIDRPYLIWSGLTAAYGLVWLLEIIWEW